VELGLDPALFWDVTPRAAMTIVEGVVDRLANEHNRFAWHAWNSVALARTKRLPRITTLFVKPRRRHRPQTWQEQRDIARMITAAYGGIVQ
jgi:hypothetical protein